MELVVVRGGGGGSGRRGGARRRRDACAEQEGVGALVRAVDGGGGASEGAQAESAACGDLDGAARAALWRRLRPPARAAHALPGEGGVGKVWRVAAHAGGAEGAR